jgi:hypothetical protein
MHNLLCFNVYKWYSNTIYVHSYVHFIILEEHLEPYITKLQFVQLVYTLYTIYVHSYVHFIQYFAWI